MLSFFHFDYKFHVKNWLLNDQAGWWSYNVYFPIYLYIILLMVGNLGTHYIEILMKEKSNSSPTPTTMRYVFLFLKLRIEISIY